MAFRPRFDNAGGLEMDVERVSGVTRGQRESSNGHAKSGRDVHLAVVLHHPASLLKLVVNLLPKFFSRVMHQNSPIAAKGITVRPFERCSNREATRWSSRDAVIQHGRLDDVVPFAAGEELTKINGSIDPSRNVHRQSSQTTRRDAVGQ